MTTRQQRRARARAPLKKKRSGVGYLLGLTALLVLGGGAVAMLRANPPEMTRGAFPGAHWHAPYQLQLCGAPVEPFPMLTEGGEVHSHGDGIIHIHPSTPAYSGDNANLGAYFESVESTIGEDEDGRRFLVLPDQTEYRDGGTCEGLEGTWDLVVTKNGERVEGDPHRLIVHDRDEIVIRFGPEPDPDTPPVPNPLTVMIQQFQQQQEGFSEDFEFEFDEEGSEEEEPAPEES